MSALQGHDNPAVRGMEQRNIHELGHMLTIEDPEGTAATLPRFVRSI